EIDGFIKRAALDAECLIARRVAMPNARAAIGTEVSLERATAVGGTAPALRAPARQGKGLGFDDQRNAERGGRLFAALGTVANVDLERRCEKFVAHLAALAAPRPGEGMRGFGHGVAAPAVCGPPVGTVSQ